MNTKIIFGIMIFAVILIGIIIIFGSYVNFPDPPSKGAMIQKTINNLNKKVDSIYRLVEGSGAEFSLTFSEDYEICFFNSSNPSPTATWNPDITTKFRINQSRYNAWYFKISEGNVAGNGYRFAYLDMPTDKNFCAPGGSKIYILRTYNGVEIEPF